LISLSNVKKGLKDPRKAIRHLVHGPKKYFHEGLINPSPDFYDFAKCLGEKFGCENIIGIGSDPKILVALHPKFGIVGLDYPDKIRYCLDNFNVGKWIEWEIDKNECPQLSENFLKKSLIICNALGDVSKSNKLLKNLKNLLDYAPICILAHSENDNIGLENQLLKNNFNLAFKGSTIFHEKNQKIKTKIAVLENNNSPNDFRKISNWTPPDDFKIIAIIASHNESDVIIPILEKLFEQEIGMYLLDNWSTDGTYELAKKFEGKGLVGLERFPKDGPAESFDLTERLERTEELCKELDANWFIHQDVDEIRDSPWKEVDLRTAIYAADRAGYNAIAHTVLLFPPTDNTFVPGSNFEKHFKYFEFSKDNWDFKRINIWKNLDRPISLASKGGHEVMFEGKKVYPYKFLFKHYPIRSQQHGEKKLFQDRKPRYSPQGRKKGWHVQYDEMNPGFVFLRSPNELNLFDDTFYENYVVELISGLGIKR